MSESSEQDKGNHIEGTMELQNLIASQQTLLLSTASPNGIPDISYALFVRDPTGHYYIFISELDSHNDSLSRANQKNPES